MELLVLFAILELIAPQARVPPGLSLLGQDTLPESENVVWE
jgi:hypothetical protein